jgi:hypothetical protein
MHAKYTHTHHATDCQGSALGPIDGLQLPLVTTDEVTVHASDQRCAGNGAAARLPAGDWGGLEAAAAGAEMPSTNWLEGGKQVRLVGFSCCWLRLIEWDVVRK